MNEQTMFRWLLAFVALVAVSLIGIVVFGDLGAQFLFGWLTFPIALLPRITVDWPSVIAGTIAFATFAFGVHHTGRWFASWLPENLIASRTWQLRQTGLVVVSVTLLFSLGTALVGAVHQVIWLSTNRAAPSLDVSVDPPPRSPIANALRNTERIPLPIQVREYGLGMHNFHGTFKHLPPGGTMNDEGELLHGWVMGLGFYLAVGSPPISTHGIKFDVPWNKPPNDRLYRCQFPGFLNPMQPGPAFDRDGFGLIHFAANSHVFPIRPAVAEDKIGRMHTRGHSFDDMTDGTSNTLLIGTVGRNHKPWGYPANVRDPGEGLNRTSTGFGGPPGQRSAHFVMADGSVREISDKADPRILRALATPNGGESDVDTKGLMKTISEGPPGIKDIR